MPVLDFPASPITGDKYPVTAVPGQPQYTYDGVKWTTIGAQISNAAPATALPLMDAATAAVGTATKYAREDHVHPKIAAAPVDALGWSGMQVNGSMEVSQELGAAGINLPNRYACDGWRPYFAGAMAVTCAQTGPIVAGFPNALGISVQTAQASLGASDLVQVSQPIEGYRTARLAWGTASAQPLTIGFWTAHHRPGLYSGVVIGAGTRSYAFTYTQNAADVAQFNVITVPGCTDGTWVTNNGIGLHVTFAMAAGSGVTAPSANTWLAAPYNAAPGQINGVAATSDAFRITGLIVLPGIAAPTAAQSPLIMRPYDQELVTCQRYYRKVLSADGVSFSATQARFNIDNRIMRAAPTISVNGVMSITDVAAANFTQSVSNISAFNVLQEYSGVDLGNFAGLTPMRFYRVLFGGGYNYFMLDARL